MLMMCPPPWRIMAGRTARQQRNAARAFTPMTRSNRFGGVSRMPAQCRAPALLTNRSIRPNRSSALAAMPSIWSASRTSTGTGRARTPSASTSAATVKTEPGSFSVDSVLFAAITTSHPSRASPMAMARPMPRLAPVTTATRPLSDGMIPRPCSVAVQRFQLGVIPLEDDAAARLQTHRQLPGRHGKRPRQDEELLHLLVAGDVGQPQRHTPLQLLAHGRVTGQFVVGRAVRHLPPGVRERPAEV